MPINSVATGEQAPQNLQIIIPKIDPTNVPMSQADTPAARSQYKKLSVVSKLLALAAKRAGHYTDISRRYASRILWYTIDMKAFHEADLVNEPHDFILDCAGVHFAQLIASI